MKGLIQKSIALQYLTDNGISYSKTLETVATTKISGIEYFTIAELFSYSLATLEQAVYITGLTEEDQTLDTTIESKTFSSPTDPNVHEVTPESLSTARKIFVGTVYTDPNTGDLVEIDPYDGGEIIVGSTPNSAPSAPSVTVSNISHSSAQLNMSGAIDSDGTIAGYNIYLAGNLFATTTNNVQILINLTPSTTYKFAVKSYDDDGAESLLGQVVSFTTTAILP